MPWSSTEDTPDLRGIGWHQQLANVATGYGFAMSASLVVGILVAVLVGGGLAYLALRNEFRT